jgi:hypothetical protein
MPGQKDLIHETSPSTGTGSFATSAVNGKVRFSDPTDGFGTGGTNVFNYFISNRDAPEWEHGTGHMSAVGTLVRDTVIRGSNGTSLVNFSAGTKDVTNDVPAAEQIRASRSIAAVGLATGGGDLSADRTITVTAATQSDQETGTSTTTVVTPGRQQFHQSAAKAWLFVAVSGGTPTLAASYNITSISDTGVGILGVTIGTDFSSGSYAMAGSVAPVNFGEMLSSSGRAAGSINLACGSAAAGFVDPVSYDAVFFGDQ